MDHRWITTDNILRAERLHDFFECGMSPLRASVSEPIIGCGADEDAVAIANPRERI